ALDGVFAGGPTLEEATARLAALRGSTDLFLFATIEHSGPLAVHGIQARSLQHLVGNPLTAGRMTQHVRAAALYAPLRVVIYEAAPTQTRIEYDLPSTPFGQFGTAPVTAVGRELDRQLADVV